MTRKAFRRLLLSLTVLLLCACVRSGERRPLMGIREAVGATERDSVATMDGAVRHLTPEKAGTTSDVRLSADNLAKSPTDMEEQLLSRMAYTVSYNKDTRCPNWVAWHLTADHTNGGHSRSGLKFAEDEDVPAPRATNMDYMRSGYDRGHMCPSGDNKWSETAQHESFLYTNCCPQLHNLNAGDWNELEQQCRYWAEAYGELWIVCGPFYLNKTHKTIGKNKVVVPEAFFKVVLAKDRDDYKALGFVYRNETANKPKSSYVNSVDYVERLTGIDFFPSLPDDIEDRVEATADYGSWR